MKKRVILRNIYESIAFIAVCGFVYSLIRIPIMEYLLDYSFTFPRAEGDMIYYGIKGMMDFIFWMAMAYVIYGAHFKKEKPRKSELEKFREMNAANEARRNQK